MKRLLALYWFQLSLLVVLCAGDTITTQIAVTKGAIEVNPLAARLLHSLCYPWVPPLGRGGRAVEGNRLLSGYRVLKTLSRVRIPASPPCQGSGVRVQGSVPVR